MKEDTGVSLSESRVRTALLYRDSRSMVGALINNMVSLSYRAAFPLIDMGLL